MGFQQSGVARMELSEAQKNLDIDSIPAGVELDKLIAEKVMGWRLGAPHYVHGPLMHGGSMQRAWEGPGLPRADGSSPFSRGFKPSTDISAAWEIVEKLCGPPYFASVFLTKGPHGHLVEFDIYPDTELYQGTSDPGHAPLAISRAALKAVLSKGD